MTSPWDVISDLQSKLEVHLQNHPEALAGHIFMVALAKDQALVIDRTGREPIVWKVIQDIDQTARDLHRKVDGWESRNEKKAVRCLIETTPEVVAHLRENPTSFAAISLWLTGRLRVDGTQAAVALGRTFQEILQS